MLLEISKEGNFLLGIWKIEETADRLKSLLTNLNAYSGELERFSSESRRKEWLAVRVLLNKVSGKEKQIVYSSSGKPYLSDRSFHVSISHTKGYVAVALHPDNIGIDIERYADRVNRVYKKFMHPCEIKNVKEERRIRDLLLHWSAKETIYKLMDISGTELKEHIRVASSLPDSEKGNFSVEEHKTGKMKVYKVYYKVYADFVLTYAYDNHSVCRDIPFF